MILPLAVLNVALSLAASAAWLKAAGLGGRNGFPQPTAQLALTFMVGMLMTLPAAGLEHGASRFAGTESSGFIAFAALTEEAFKMTAMIIGARAGRRENSSIGTLTAHAAAASLGFAAAENVVYLTGYGSWAILARGPLNTLYHLALGLIWGRAAEYQAEKEGYAPTMYVLAAFSLAGGIHAAYNISVLAVWQAKAPAAALCLWWVWLGYPRRGQEATPEDTEEQECRYCAGEAAQTYGFCPGVRESHYPRGLNEPK